MLYITMLRQRQTEKLTHLKNLQKRLNELQQEEDCFREQFRDEIMKGSVQNALLEVQKERNMLEADLEATVADITHNSSQIEKEEENLAREAARAKSRVMAVKELSRLGRRLNQQV